MNFSRVKTKAKDFFNEASFVSNITTEEEYDLALQLMDELIEEYDQYLPLIEVLSAAIKKWEDESESLLEFNRMVDELDLGVAVLRTLMDQHYLQAKDLREEIGTKSLVSMILKGERNLTRSHIQKLSDRFNITPSMRVSQ